MGVGALVTAVSNARAQAAAGIWRVASLMVVGLVERLICVVAPPLKETTATRPVVDERSNCETMLRAMSLMSSMLPSMEPDLSSTSVKSALAVQAFGSTGGIAHTVSALWPQS